MSKSDNAEQVARRLLKVAGTTYAAEAGIRINDKPMPLFQLLVLRRRPTRNRRWTTKCVGR
jgi:hypothetical protein